MSRGDIDLDARVLPRHVQQQRQAAAESVADLSELTADEGIILEVLAACATGGTTAQLRSKSGLSEERLMQALDGLRAKGLVARLNTVIESYSCRFPGVRVS